VQVLSSKYVIRVVIDLIGVVVFTVRRATVVLNYRNLDFRAKRFPGFRLSLNRYVFALLFPFFIYALHGVNGRRLCRRLVSRLVRELRLLNAK
jgi:hypothetical protein